MKGMSQSPNRLPFKFRRFFYLIPVVLGASISPKFRFLFHSYVSDEIYEVFCFLVILSGFFIRLLASGTSVRFLRKGDSKYRVGKLATNFTGIFSLWRHPHFAGDLIIVAGLALLSQNVWTISASLLFFLVCYLPIILQKERWMEKNAGPSYDAYRKKTGLIIPSFWNWKRSRTRLRMQAALYKEGGVLLYLIFLFVFFEGLRDSVIERHLYFNFHWLALAGFSVLIWNLHHRRSLSSEDISSQEWPE